LHHIFTLKKRYAIAVWIAVPLNYGQTSNHACMSSSSIQFEFVKVRRKERKKTIKDPPNAYHNVKTSKKRTEKSKTFNLKSSTTRLGRLKPYSDFE